MPNSILLIDQAKRRGLGIAMKNKTHRIQIRPDLYEKLMAQAREECRSPQTVLAMLIEAALPPGDDPANIVPFRTDAEERSWRLAIKLTPDEFDGIASAALLQGKTATEYIEERALSAASLAKVSVPGTA